MPWASDPSKISADIPSTSDPDGLNVILIRHGRSTFNDQKRHQGNSDDSILTPRGETMAQITGAYLSRLSLKITGLYSSPLNRAKRTAIHIRDNLDPRLSIQISPQLTEVDLAYWQGLTYQQVEQQYPEEYRCWHESPHLLQIGFSESDRTLHWPLLTLYQQAQEFWQHLIVQHRQGTVVVVSHSGTIRALLSTATGLHPQNYHQIQQSNCGISVVDLPANRNRYGKLREVNSTQHLDEILPKLKSGKRGLRLLLIPAELTPTSVDRILHPIGRSTLDFTLDSSTADLSDLLGERGVEQQNPISPGLADLYTQHRSKDPAPSRPVTGLVRAPSPLLLSLLRQCFDPNCPHPLSGPLDGLSVLHYPSVQQRPILQGLNLYGSPFVHR